MKQELMQYEITPEGFWQCTWMYGDGYNVMEVAHQQKWRAIPGWGKDGYDLGDWPYVIIFMKNLQERYDIIYYVEGDVTMYSAPTKEIRDAIVNEIAFFHWKQQDEEWVQGYDTVDQLPDELKGPYRR